MCYENTDVYCIVSNFVDSVDCVNSSDYTQHVNITIQEEGDIISDISRLLFRAMGNRKEKFKVISSDKTEWFQWTDGNSIVNIVVQKDVEVSPEEEIAQQKKDIEQDIKIYKNHLYHNDEFDTEVGFDKTFNDYTPNAWRVQEKDGPDKRHHRMPTMSSIRLAMIKAEKGLDELLKEEQMTEIIIKLDPKLNKSIDRLTKALHNACK